MEKGIHLDKGNHCANARFREIFDSTGSRLLLVLDGQEISLEKYNWKALEAQFKAPDRLYLGLPLREIMDSGRDLLGERILANGIPRDCAAVSGILPRQSKGAFGFISGQASWNGIILSLQGGLYPQTTRTAVSELEMFSPTLADPELGQIPPAQVWLDGSLPIAIGVHMGKKRILELTYVCEPGDSSRDPSVWIRAVTLEKDTYDVCAESFFVCGRQLDHQLSATTTEDYWDVFESAACHWLNFRSSFANLQLPDPMLQRALYGCISAAAITFSDAHPHYGHCDYAWETHDNFPPTFITAIESAILMGNAAYAGRVADYILRCVVDSKGRFCYRQGADRLFGASASEYGQFIWLLERYEAALSESLNLEDPKYLEILTRMGGMLIDSVAPLQAYPELSVVQMCAEADTNGRVYSYVQNGYWTYRGLTALADLMDRHGADGTHYRKAAEVILANTNEAARRLKVDTPYGPLLPFQLEYTATPMTLSNCHDTFYPLSHDEWSEYLQESNVRGRFETEQDYLENTYANYRYYLEMLSARCMKREEEAAIVRLRESLGGELLGMTRFLNRVDDWPVFNYARFLLETDRLEKYLLLLYAHTYYHGIPEMMCYYEQIGLDGRAYAPDCVPSILITPLMISWMIAFEPVGERALYLLRGAPEQWYHKGFSAKGMNTRWGKVNLAIMPEGKGVRITADLPDVGETPVFLDVRGLNAERMAAAKSLGYPFSIIDEGTVRLTLSHQGHIEITV